MTKFSVPVLIRSAAGASAKRMNRPLPLFTYFMAGCFFPASLGYFLLRPLMPEGWVFGALYRMFLYHWEKPCQYIFVVALFYAIIATPLASRCRTRNRKPSNMLILLAMIAPVALASPFGGVLWVIHDMQAGYFTEGSRFREDLQWGALEGIRNGWLVIVTSVPYNLLGLVAGYFITRFGFTPEIRRGIPQGCMKSLAELGSSLPEKRNGAPPVTPERSTREP